MTIEQAISHFGTQAALARALGISRASVNEWTLPGATIPRGRQFELHVLTGGDLAVDPAFLPGEETEAKAA